LRVVPSSTSCTEFLRFWSFPVPSFHERVQGVSVVYTSDSLALCSLEIFGSVRGVPGNRHSYRDPTWIANLNNLDMTSFYAYTMYANNEVMIRREQ